MYQIRSVSATDIVKPQLHTNWCLAIKVFFLGGGCRHWSGP